MKLKLLAVAAASLPTVLSASDFAESLQKIDAENPQVVLHANVENDFAVLGSFLTDMYMSYLMTSPDVPPIPVDFNKLFDRLGLSTLTSMTMASMRADVAAYRNEFIAEFSGDPAGLFLIGGTENQPFTVPDIAPADADLVFEMNFEGEIFFSIIRGIVIDMMGPMGENIIDGQMNQPLSEGGPTLAEVIKRLTTNIQVAVKPDFGDGTPVSTAKAFLNGQGIVRIADIADLIDSFVPMLEQAGFTPVVGSEGQSWMMVSPNPELPFSLYLTKMAESNDLAVSLGEDSLSWFLTPDNAIGGMEEFKKITQGLPREGLSFWYSTKEMGTLQIQNLDADLQNEDPQMVAIFANLKEFLLRFTGTQASVSYLDDQAYRTTSIQPASLKANFGLVAVGFSAGIMAAVTETQRAAAAAAAAAEEEETASPSE